MTQQYPYSPSGSSGRHRPLRGLRRVLPARSRRHRILGGVCGGLAVAWGLPPVLVRVAVLLLALLPGPMWVAYALAWLAMPPEEAAAWP